MAHTQEQARRMFDDFMRKLERNICPFCDRPIESREQVMTAVYADPCGHRLYHGKA